MAPSRLYRGGLADLIESAEANLARKGSTTCWVNCPRRAPIGRPVSASAAMLGRVNETARANRAHWDAKSAAYQERFDPLIGAQPKLWGAWSIPEAQVGALGALDGLKVLELGCGGGQWAAGLEDEADLIVGLDLSAQQLAAARRKSRSLPVVLANGEVIPVRDASLDLVFCDHGAMSWGDPYRTVPEVARVLRPGGRLVFNASSPLVAICWDEDADRLGRGLRADYFGMLRFGEDDTGAASYTLGYGEWIRVFRSNGLQVEDLIELRARDDRPSPYWPSDPPDWHRHWPAEMLWVTRKEA